MMSKIYASMTTGNDSNVGTIDSRKKHIHAAIDISSSGDSILLADGTYDEEIGRSLTHQIQIKSESADYRKVIIKPKTLVASTGGGAWLFDNFGLSTVQDATLILDKNNLTNPYSGGNGSMLIELHSNDSSRKAIINRCLLDSVNWPTTDITQGIACLYSSGAKLYKSVVRGFGWGFFANLDSQVTVRDSIFMGNGYAIELNSGSISDVDYCCFYGNTHDISPAGSIGAHSITSDPNFTTGVEIDRTSPCCDAGIMIPSYVTTWVGLNPDIGCFEASLRQVFLQSEYYDHSGSANAKRGSLSKIWDSITDYWQLHEGGV